MVRRNLLAAVISLRRPLGSALGLAVSSAGGAWGQTVPTVPQRGTPERVPAPVAPWEADLLGDAAGVRPWLAARGVSISLVDTDEVLGNPTGGIRRQGIFEGAALATLGVDAGRAFGLAGGAFTASAYGLYGRGLSENALDNLNTVSGIEADRSLRLFELWYEQSFFGGRATLRIGQQSIDQEFLVDQFALPFVNAFYGFASLPSTDLPGGAPVFPLGTPGIRLKLQPTDGATVLLGLFNGDPAPRGFGNDPQARDGAGTAFRLDGGALWWGEAQWSRNQAPGAAGLPVAVKVGGWYHSSRFADLRLDASGRSLADPASSGRPLLWHGDWSLYALADRMLWRPASGNGGIAGFARVMGAPGDRNLVDYSADGGVTWQGMLPGRDNDTVGVGLEWARVGDQASKLDGDTARLSGTVLPVRRWEAAMELTYQAQVRPGWQVQPDLQYIVRPGGGVPDPAAPSRRTGDALVLGLRTTLNF